MPAGRSASTLASACARSHDTSARVRLPLLSTVASRGSAAGAGTVNSICRQKAACCCPPPLESASTASPVAAAAGSVDRPKPPPKGAGRSHSALEAAARPAGAASPGAAPASAPCNCFRSGELAPARIARPFTCKLPAATVALCGRISGSAALLRKRAVACASLPRLLKCEAAPRTFTGDTDPPQAALEVDRTAAARAGEAAPVLCTGDAPPAMPVAAIALRPAATARACSCDANASCKPRPKP